MIYISILNMVAAPVWTVQSIYFPEYLATFRNPPVLQGDHQAVGFGGERRYVIKNVGPPGPRSDNLCGYPGLVPVLGPPGTDPENSLKSR